MFSLGSLVFYFCELHEISFRIYLPVILGSKASSSISLSCSKIQAKHPPRVQICLKL